MFLFVPAQIGLLRVRKYLRRDSSALLDRFRDLRAHSFEQRRHVQKIIGRRDFQFVGKLGQVG